MKIWVLQEINKPYSDTYFLTKVEAIEHAKKRYAAGNKSFILDCWGWQYDLFGQASYIDGGIFNYNYDTKTLEWEDL